MTSSFFAGAEGIGRVIRGCEAADFSDSWTNTNPTTHMETPVSALMERKGSAVHAVTSTITVAEAVAEMNKHRIGSIVIIDAGRIVGIFTERDVLRRVVGAEVDP